jgi:uncharacterized hydrophobic protein (TIGR00341 family)
MRQLLIQAHDGCGQAIIDIAKSNDAINIAAFEAHGPEGPLDVVVIHVSNSRVNPVIKQLQAAVPDLRLSMFPEPVIALRPPASHAPQQVTDVERLSPIEVYMASQQSIGSWSGTLGYAIAAGIIVWIGLFTNTIYLLIAAMLIAPFAGPAMNIAIATTIGDPKLFRQGIARYFVALAVTIAAAAVLTILLNQQALTTLIVDVSQLSAVAVILPLIAGAAGALNLVQSPRSSLVAGTAVGVLVAASLAPPAGVTGIAIAMGAWRMALRGLFVLILQLVGINLAGSVVFRWHGLTPGIVRYGRGKQWVFYTAIALTVVALAGLLFLQLSNPPALQRATRAQQAAQRAEQVIDASDLAEVIELNMRFTGADIEHQNTLLGVIYVQRRAGVDLPADQIRQRLATEIQLRLAQTLTDVVPLVEVHVLEPAGTTP